MSYPDVPIGRVNNVNKSCKVIKGNPPYCSRVKVLAVVGPQGYYNLLEKSAPVSYCQVQNQYKQRVSLSIYHTFTHTQLQRITERDREKKLGQERERERDYSCWEIILLYLGLILVLIQYLRKLHGFLLYGFPEENICVYCLLCLIVVLVILSIKDPKIMLA